jgi:hypothetical protein
MIFIHLPSELEMSECLWNRLETWADKLETLLNQCSHMGKFLFDGCC